MWIVRLALSRPYTFVIISFFIMLLSGAAMMTMPVDIFPYIDIPVLSVIFNYGGLSAEEMANRVTTFFERNVSSNVNDIEHIESTALNGNSIIRIYLQPGARIELAQGQVIASGQSALRPMPPGIFPPTVVKYDASSVPVLQLGIGSKTLTEQELTDYSNNFMRTQLATAQGATIPQAYGGKNRQILVDLDPNAMYSHGVSASDVSNALALQNLILPAGFAKFGNRDYQININSSPIILDEMNGMPVKVVNGATVYLRDVAQVRDGANIQNNIVRVNGTRGALLTVMRNGRASTIAVVNQVRKLMPKVLEQMPPELDVRELLDQSLFVRASVEGVLREATLSAALTGLMILIFLGSWRSTIIVCTSIPLSILCSIIVLWATGQTINVMTLGGMALAVGILVDDATVEMENTHRNMAMKKPLVRAILDGAQQIAAPALVSTLCICIVFVPVLLLTGAAKYLFTPLAEAVVFAMLASYLASRTIVPNMAHYMLRPEMRIYLLGHEGHAAGGKGIIWSVHNAFNKQFEKMRAVYISLLDWALDHRGLVVSAFMIFSFGSLGLAKFIGQDFFPNVDSGQIRLHARAPSGTRIEETEVLFAKIENSIRGMLPKGEVDTIIDNIGLPGGSALSYGDQPNIGVSDGEILLSLKPERKGTVEDYTSLMRKNLGEAYPDVVFYFEPANITNQILNFGMPAPIDVQITARNGQQGYKLAREIEAKLVKVPGAADVHIHQVMDYPVIKVDVDRSKAGQIGLTQRDVSNSLLISLSGSGNIAPTQWLNWANGVQYGLTVQTPQRNLDSLDALLKTPISGGAAFMQRTADSMMGSADTAVSGTGAGPSQASLAYGNPGSQAGNTQLLSNIATTSRGLAAQIVNHYNVQPVFDVYANIDHADLGRVGYAVEDIVKKFEPSMPKGTSITVRGQIDTMISSFQRLGLGMVFAIVLVYLLMALNFQSWLDPFIILMALPGALAGIVWILFVTGTSFSVPSLMGSIMCIGVATANSILMVVFANDQRLEGMDARAAALSAGATRIRPVLMTASAMIIGMMPMALGMGEGGEQNSPLGRAVIGGLAFATVTTLFVVPIIYSVLRRKVPVDFDQKLAEEENEDISVYLEEGDHLA